MTVSREELARARELAGKATPGTREVIRSKRARSKWAKVIIRESQYVCTLYSELGGTNYNNDAEFIAHCNPEFILRLLDAYESLQAEHERGLEVIRFYADKSAWEHSEEYFECDDFLKVLDNDEEKIEGDFYGGRRARAYLKSLEQKGGVDEGK